MHQASMPQALCLHSLSGEPKTAEPRAPWALTIQRLRLRWPDWRHAVWPSPLLGLCQKALPIQRQRTVLGLPEGASHHGKGLPAPFQVVKIENRPWGQAIDTSELSAPPRQ